MKKNPLKQFSLEAIERAKSYQSNKALQDARQKFFEEINKAKYAYNFFWLGVPILQIPQDLQAMQEIIWEIKPDLIIETGMAWGGSIIFSASMLALIDYSEAVKTGETLVPKASKRRVLGIDIEIRPHNREAIEAHPMAHLIEMIEGSSVAPEVVDRVKTTAKGYKKILVFLDANHTHDHVLAELEAYAPLTSVGSYCIVWDTGIEDLPKDFCNDRPWNKGNNPKTAVWEFLRNKDRFVIDKDIESKLIITAAPDGYLKKVR